MYYRQTCCSTSLRVKLRLKSLVKNWYLEWISEITSDYKHNQRTLLPFWTLIDNIQCTNLVSDYNYIFNRKSVKFISHFWPKKSTVSRLCGKRLSLLSPVCSNPKIILGCLIFLQILIAVCSAGFINWWRRGFSCGLMDGLNGISTL